MSRSSYIYLAVDANSANRPVIAAFTVKREMVSWGLKYTFPRSAQIQVFRIRDNGEGEKDGYTQLGTMTKVLRLVTE